MQLQSIDNETHIENEGCCCPFCGVVDIVGEDLSVEGSVVTQRVSCNECNEEWIDRFILAGYESSVR